MNYAECYAALLTMGIRGRWNLTVETWHVPGKEQRTTWEFYGASCNEDGSSLLLDELPNASALIRSVGIALQTCPHERPTEPEDVGSAEVSEPPYRRPDHHGGMSPAESMRDAGRGHLVRGE